MCFTGIPVLFYSEDGDNLNLIDWNDLVSIIFRGGSRTAVTSKPERFVIIVNGCKPLTIITMHSVLDVAAVLDPPLTLGSNFAGAVKMKDQWHQVSVKHHHLSVWDIQDQSTVLAIKISLNYSLVKFWLN